MEGATKKKSRNIAEAQPGIPVKNVVPMLFRVPKLVSFNVKRAFARAYFPGGEAGSPRSQEQ